MQCMRPCNSAAGKNHNQKKGIKLYVEDIGGASSKGIVIVPALFIEDKLYAYGDIDEDKFLDRLQLHFSDN